VDASQTPPDPQQVTRRGISAPVFLGTLALGAVIGGMAVEYWLVRHGVATTTAQTAQTTLTGDAAADLAHLKNIIPTQSHTMKDVGDHWNNLWFAVEKKNWPLARFFLDQARQQARWTIAIRPERVLPDGSKVDLKGLLTATDLSAFANVQLAIEDQNKEEFVNAYKQALAACHACHSAIGMPFLRPTVPTVHPSTILDFEPATK
jgi:hypothetical protein